jgi:hypothetical protein
MVHVTSNVPAESFEIDVVVPTVRWNPHARGLLSYIAAAVDAFPGEVTLHISDNSCLPEKHAFLKRLRSDRVRVYLQDKDLGAHGNGMFLIEQLKAPYTQTVGDDDWMHVNWLENVSAFRDTPGLSAVMGTFISYPSGSARVVHAAERFMRPAPAVRSLDFIRFMLEETGVNWAVLALHRRETYIDFARYLTQHPIRHQFFDQLLSQLALLRGPVLGVNNGLTLYNQKTDSLSSGRPDQIARLSVEHGLPAWFHKLGTYSWGVEYATFYHSKLVAPLLSMTERKTVADGVYSYFLEKFRHGTYLPQRAAYDEFLVFAGIRENLDEALAVGSFEAGLANMQRIIRKHNPELGDQYAEFLRQHCDLPG